MNILVLTPLVPYPPHDGDKLRLYHFLRYLKSRGHKIDLFCLTRVEEDLAHLGKLEPLCRQATALPIHDLDFFFNLLGGALIGQSLNVSAYFSPDLREILKGYWETPDGRSINVVLAHRLRMAPAAFEGNPGVPVVMELTDSLAGYSGQLRNIPNARFSRRMAAKWDHWFLQREEVEWSDKAARTVVISRTDAQVLLENGVPAGKVVVIPNGVDPQKPAGSKKDRIYPSDKAVSFVGNMGYAPNEDGALWFLKRVWPKVKREVPDAVFAAVGGSPRRRLARYHNGRDLLVTGWVPFVEPYVSQACLTLAPLRVASGMQNKVALSLAMGVPVVATPQAVGWLPAKDRSGVIVGGTEGELAAQVVKVLRSPRRYQTEAKKGRRFILKNYRWKASGALLEKVLKEAARKGGKA
ncbi:MAG TPA: glycosyltransferase [bacterium]|nr:glycosyltransferase [bacterium]